MGALGVLLRSAEHEAERMTYGICEDAKPGLVLAVQPARSQRHDAALGHLYILDTDVHM